MKKLTQIIRETIMETFDEFANPYHIVVIIDKENTDIVNQLNEGRWIPSGEKGYMQRIDKPNFDFERLHVHIARNKHINSKSKQVAWNDDGTRHDKKTFNDNFKGMETAKRIARNALGLADDMQLENISEPSSGELLLENIESIPSKSSVFIFKLIIKTILND